MDQAGVHRYLHRLDDVVRADSWLLAIHTDAGGPRTLHLPRPARVTDAITGELVGAGKTVVFTNGCFNLLHVGHVRCLQAARRLGDLLVVALNDDESVRRLKGLDYPVVPLEERMEVVAALEGVDLVTGFSQDRVNDLLLLLRPHVHAKGTDYTTESVPERDTVRSYEGRIAIVGDPKSHSVRDLIRYIRGER